MLSGFILLLFYSRAAGSYSWKAVVLVDAVAVHGG
jgi:hypothetical protein